MSSRKYSGHGMKMELSSSMDSKVSTVASLKFSMTMIFAVPRPTRPRRTRKTGRVHFDILMRGITGREISSYRIFNYSTRFICLHRKYLSVLYTTTTHNLMLSVLRSCLIRDFSVSHWGLFLPFSPLVFSFWLAAAEMGEESLLREGCSGLFSSFEFSFPLLFL